MWYREQLTAAISFRSNDESLYVEPTLGTRIMFEELYKIPVSLQIKFEQYLDSLETLENIKFDLLLDFMPDSWKDYYDKC